MVNLDLNDRLHAVTTIIETAAADSAGQDLEFQGTGFFYARSALPDGPGPQWVPMHDISLVTNRHVLLPKLDGNETRPIKIKFKFRRIGPKGMIWDEVSLSETDISNVAKFHPDDSVDVALFEISDILTDRVKSGEKYAAPYFLGPQMFAGKNNIDVEASDDVLVVGYPKGFYDRVNLFPIIKSGIIATRWRSGFEGKPQFLIDAKLFPGSSGSVVLSKPVDMVIKDGKMMTNKQKQFALLGVFSGEPMFQEMPVQLGELTITRKSGFDLGTVWYAELIEEILDKGVDISEALSP